MPELPEVRTVAKKLNSNVTGKTIKKVNVYLDKIIKEISPKSFSMQLENHTINGVSNIGKFLVFDLGEIQLLSHLRMVGKYKFDDERSKHDHVEFIFNDGTKLLYNDARQFGTMQIRTNDTLTTTNPILKMANEPGKTDPSWLWGRLQSKSIAIKTALLDQTLLVGLGNIYVNEALWECEVHPETPSKDVSLDQIQLLLLASEKIMNESTKMGGSTIHNFKSFGEEIGGYQEKLLVHGKENMPCPRCGNTIEKIRVNGRGTYYCSSCQKL